MRLRLIETGSLFTFTNSKTIKHGCILKPATTLFYILLILYDIILLVYLMMVVELYTCK